MLQGHNDLLPTDAPVTVTPPVEKVGELAQSAGAAPAPLILIVDDNVDAARMLAILLKHEGFEVEMAHDGADAVRRAAELRPRYVLLDIGLPKMDGFEVAKRIRQLETCEDVVIIGVTGFGQKADQSRSAEAGFDYHLIKPVEYDIVSSLISKAEKRRAMGL